MDEIYMRHPVCPPDLETFEEEAENNVVSPNQNLTFVFNVKHENNGWKSK
jgi:hypothetical protein